jgi:hypothetical protein
VRGGWLLDRGFRFLCLLLLSIESQIEDLGGFLSLCYGITGAKRLVVLDVKVIQGYEDICNSIASKRPDCFTCHMSRP